MKRLTVVTVEVQFPADVGIPEACARVSNAINYQWPSALSYNPDGTQAAIVIKAAHVEETRDARS